MQHSESNKKVSTITYISKNFIDVLKVAEISPEVTEISPNAQEPLTEDRMQRETQTIQGVSL